MIDIEKIAKGLECCSDEVCHKEEGCPYYDKAYHGSCQIKLHEEALALAKSQLPMKRKTNRMLCFECPRCYQTVGKYDNFCKMCGQAFITEEEEPF